MQKRDYLSAILASVVMFLSANAVSAPWTVEKDFEDQSLGEKCLPFFITNADSTISTDMSSSGNNSCKFAVVKGGTGWGGGFGYPEEVRKGGEVWIRFRLFIPNGFDFNAYSAGDHLKFIRHTIRNDVGSSGSSTLGRLDWYWDREGRVPPHRLILERDDVWQPFGDASDTPARARWQTYEMYTKFDDVAKDDGGEGRVLAWIDGKLIGDLTSRPTMWAGSTRILSALIFSYWNGGSPDTQHLYLDDLVATNTVPPATDSAGNPYIGVGNFVQVFPPNPPVIQR